MKPPASVRRFPRAPWHFRVGYKNFEGRSDLTGDISLGGAFIQTPNPAARGALLGLYLDVPSVEGPLEMGAEVIWCKAGQNAGMGVQFIYTSEPHRWLLETQLEKLSSN
jgi:hypothetical protein